MGCGTIDGLEQRFASKVLVDDASGCWLWQASGPKGYGLYRISGRPENKRMLAHRFAYEALVGPIPEGLVLDHLCRTPACVNPAHLEPVTQRENTLRGEGPAAKAARRTHCVNGHPLEGENIYNSRKGWRQCRTCNRAIKQKKAVHRGVS